MCGNLAPVAPVAPAARANPAARFNAANAAHRTSSATDQQRPVPIKCGSVLGRGGNHDDAHRPVGPHQPRPGRFQRIKNLAPEFDSLKRFFTIFREPAPYESST